MLFGQPAAARARETGVPERTLRRKVVRFARVRHAQPLRRADALRHADRRRLPAEIRHAIVDPEGGVPALQPARDRAHLPAPLRPPGRPPHRRAGAEPPSRCRSPAAALPALPRDRRSRAAPAGRSCVSHAEGGAPRRSPATWAIARSLVYETLRAVAARGLAGSRGPADRARASRRARST